MIDHPDTNAPMKAATFTGAIHDLAGHRMVYVYRDSERVTSPNLALSPIRMRRPILTR